MTFFLIGAVMMATACGNTQDEPNRTLAEQPSATASARPARRELTPEEKKFYRDVAQSAWRFMDANYNAGTGLVSATADWANTTVWDIGGQLLAFESAKELGLITPEDFKAKVGRTLATLQKAPLYQGVAYNKTYSTKSGGFGEGGAHGYAATDLGRLLGALKIVSVHEPELKDQVAAVVRRIDMSKVVKDGYLYGMLQGSRGQPWSFQEGRIGYEQYVARGFSEWGADVANALDVTKNGRPKKVMGVQILEDTRYQDRLLSEPFILYGLEYGLTGPYGDLAAAVLKAQQARFDSTGKMTIVSEDASTVAPYYFYYYCVYCNGKPFSIDVATPGKGLDGPRWVSTKATFGWNAIMPNDYTKKAMEFVAAANDPAKGWASGVMEDSRRSTKSWDINTAAVLLEVAAYQLRGGKPLIEPASASGE
jgi:hypothetical protein